ncbi:hypothetical protein AB0L53_31935 [Nonomuraea sp. NPDC052129]
MNRRNDRPDLWALVGLLLLAVTVAIVVLTSSPSILESEIIK